MNPETVESIDALIEVCEDGESGRGRCAARAESKALAETLGRHACDGARSADESQTVVLQHGADPERRGSVAGTLHRGWVGVRDALAPAGGAALPGEGNRDELRALRQAMPGATPT
jgi:uncharacterized protein (TIGR02284 family)